MAYLKGINIFKVYMCVCFRCNASYSWDNLLWCISRKKGDRTIILKGKNCNFQMFVNKHSLFVLDFIATALVAVVFNVFFYFSALLNRRKRVVIVRVILHLFKNFPNWRQQCAIVSLAHASAFLFFIVLLEYVPSLSKFLFVIVKLRNDCNNWVTNWLQKPINQATRAQKKTRKCRQYFGIKSINQRSLEHAHE